MTRLITGFVIILIGFNLTANGQSKLTKISINDSVKIQTRIVGFYIWYADLIKRQKLNKEFNPTFKKDANGMTTLDFTKYAAGLRKYDFTEDFINRKIKGFTTCVDNLQAIPYDTFLAFKDIDQLEEIKCDFANVYEWTKSMNPLDGAELIKLDKIDKNTMEAKVRFYNSAPDGVKQYWGSATVTIIQFRTGWMINDLK